MPSKSLEINPELERLEVQIRTDLREAVTAVGLVQDQMKVALVSAWAAGKGLLQAKANIKHGGFMDWCERFKTDQRTLTRYMAIASNWETLSDLPSNKREAYMLLGAVPDKEKIEHEGDRPLGNLPSLISVVTEWARIKRLLEKKEAQINAEEIKTQYRPMYDWLKGLYGE